MKVRWLGWAGIEVEAEGASVVIDPLADPGAVFAPLGSAAAGGEEPAVTAPRSERSALAGMVTHLHRDHADAGALAAALAPDAPVLHPQTPIAEGPDDLGLAQADAELSAAELRRAVVEPWQAVEAGPFKLIAVPAVDGLGDPQLSWVVEAGGRRMLHLGDTTFHALWWRIARRLGPFDLVLAPINGAVVSFPHRQPPSPLPAVMDPEQAALAGELLGARAVAPIHHAGYRLEPFYVPVEDDVGRLRAAASGRSYELLAPERGEPLKL